MPATHVLTLDTGGRVQGASPGQFLHLRCGDAGQILLRRPMSIYRGEADAFQLMIRRVGKGSAWLTSRLPGDQLDCIGPQGHGFRLDRNARHLLFVGGGYGVAPLVGLAEQAIRKGMSVALAVGAAGRDLVFPVRLLPPEVEYLVATDDGSAGHRGLVTEFLSDRVEWADSVYACGPIPMMAALSVLMRKKAPRKPCQIAMEERMGCSMGVCLGCVVETTRGPRRVCTDGPVFDIQQIVWREAAVGMGALHGRNGQV